MNRRTIVTAIVILIASILAPLQIDAAEQATPTPSSPEFVESDGDDDGGEPAVKPRTPEVRNVIVNMHASAGQWRNAEGNLQNHNIVKTRLATQRDLLKYGLDDNTDRFSARRLAEKNNEIRLHLAYAQRLLIRSRRNTNNTRRIGTRSTTCTSSTSPKGILIKGLM